jgi:DNA modification methylase
MALFKQEKQSIPSSLLKDKYGWPPFSVLNTISFDWQRRKDEWETVIEDSTIGRDTKRFNATPTNTFSARGASAKKAESISSFDPYLCELMYRWFSVPNAVILDPFAGGNVRGTVAAVLGRDYYGIDLSSEQVIANYKHFTAMKEKYTNISGDATWLRGDSDDILTTYDKEFDMVLTCPPYYNMEVYSKDPRDLSRMPNYTDFLHKYAKILERTAACLKEDSFFVIVVSEVRADSHDISNSHYLGLVPDTIKILQNCGLSYYNEIILMNNIGSLPVRAPKFFDRTRKIGRHHQNVLVFYKGDLSNIEEKFGKVSVQ